MNISPKNKSLTPFPLIGRGPLFSVAVFTWSPQAKSWHEVIFPSYPMAASHLTDILSGLFSFPQWLWPWFYMCCFSYSWPAHLISHPSITCSKTKKVEEQQTVADSPSLRLRLAKPGPWLLDSSEELVKEARGKEANSWIIGKDPDDGKDWRQKEKWTTEDEMVGWHYRPNGHGFG